MRAYTILLTPSLEDGGYTVRLPAFPGCTTKGDMTEKAFANAREAISVYIADLVEGGEDIPEETGPNQVIAVDVAT